ncbi:Transposon Ty3-I Gag-Pol polyprotein [Sesbania bispinosa]|nr:Transposon Ty3-I Gag-Pol polyprotein [Sesbania bispinosa]
MSQYVHLPLITTSEGSQLQPLTVLDARQVRIHDAWVPQVLIQWEGTADCTWDCLSSVQEHFSQFDLEDKVIFYGEGNVMMKNNLDDNSRGQVAINSGHKDNLHGAMRRSNRIQKTPLRLRD